MRVLKRVIQSLGYYYAKRDFMPLGIDWAWDIQRLNRGRPLNTVFDVGANIGQTATILSHTFPSSVIHSFEPVASTYATLKANTQSMQNVFCHQLAVSSKQGLGKMLCTDNSLTNRLDASEDQSRADQDSQETVRITSVDEFCRQSGIQQIDLLKIDVEGNEANVITGAASCLSERRIRFILAEIGFNSDDAGHCYAPTLLKLLGDQGMTLYALYDYCKLLPPHYTEAATAPVFANALFVQAKASE
jgi:FkbM family methyltransferase